MDLVAASRAFVAVAERGSFTDGAAIAGVPQSVASRRVAALERHLGQRVFDRTTRRIVLTPFGRDVLPAARRLAELADALEHDAARAALRPLSLAVPETIATRDLAALDVAARAHGYSALELVPAGPAARRRLAETAQVRAALVPAPAADAVWTVPLGLATAPDATRAPDAPVAPVVRLQALRPSRTERSSRTVWLQPEDDVPHVRDRMVREGQSAGLLPSQVAVARTLAAAVAEVLRTTDLLLCSAVQAGELGLSWHPLGDPDVARGYVVSAAVRDDARDLRQRLGVDVAGCLGVPPTGAPSA
ncbi:LysR family transcriptional regulator [Patulibacter americanus]|uniref:LysR family transcriptional regulator n=1 Tax=Patulibacter americanus TaxID=588672 RepID=UPI0003B3547C|nr:LysR family transcriptional regulator [Patulibacter americanus]